MTISAELERIAEAARAFATAGERVAAVLPTEARSGMRIYLCAFSDDAGERTSWLALDADGQVVDDRAAVRQAASIAALCEIAVESAGGGDVASLRAELVALRLRESPPGIDEAEEAALELERVLGSPPRIASPGYLDALGAATLRLEHALGDDGSPFAGVMRGAVPVVDALVADVERSYKRPLE